MGGVVVVMGLDGHRLTIASAEHGRLSKLIAVSSAIANMYIGMFVGQRWGGEGGWGCKRLLTWMNAVQGCESLSGKC